MVKGGHKNLVARVLKQYTHFLENYGNGLEIIIRQILCIHKFKNLKLT